MPKGIGLADWDRCFADRCGALRRRYRARAGPGGGGESYLHPPSHWAAAGDRRLERLRYDPDPASLALCSFVESQAGRLRALAGSGAAVVAAMKDLGTVPAMLAAAPGVACFAADLAFMQPTTSEDPRFLDAAEALGLGPDFCDVRAAVGALAADFGSDPAAAAELLGDVLSLCRRRSAAGDHAVDPGAVRLTWVTPSMDACLQNLLEDLGARVAGTEYMTGQALAPLDPALPPLAALARAALADTMVGSSARRAALICDQARRFRAEGVVLVTFFGASHCAREGRVVTEEVRARLDIPVLALGEQTRGGDLSAGLRSRLGAFVEMIRARRAGAATVPTASKGGSVMPGSSASPAAPVRGVFGRLEDAILDELAWTEAERGRGRKLVGIYCEYTPRELIMAAGAIPVCLCGFTPEMVGPAEADLPANLCPLIKSSWGYIREEACPFFENAAAIVAETTCDGKKKMYELVAERKPTFVLELTQKYGSEAAFAHWRGEVRGLKAFLEETLEVRITDEALGRAIGDMNAWRRRRLGLLDYSRGEEVYVTGVERLLANMRIACSPVEAGLLDAVFEELERRRAAGRPVAAPGAPRVLVTGVPIGIGVEKAVRLVEEGGGIVVVQEACSGVKPLVEPVAEEGDPLESIARKYFSLPCPCFTPNPGRFELLDRLADEFRPDAVIDVVWMACHTFNVESVLVRRWAQKRGLPFLKVETDYSASDTEGLRTRVESLLEMARARRGAALTGGAAE